jgi:4-oxalocrotonate tautomerase family enzyme
MPMVTIKILKGRSKKKLHQVMLQITEVMSRELGYDKKHISVYLEEVEHNAFMENGETGDELITRFGAGHKYQGN